MCCDEAADRGKGLQEGHMEREEGRGALPAGDKWCADLSPLYGEGSCAVVGRDGRVVQGDIVQALQAAGWEVQRHYLRCSASERARSWYWAREVSCGAARRQVACCTEVPQRFLVRAWADCLPTYQNIARRTRGRALIFTSRCGGMERR